MFSKNERKVIFSLATIIAFRMLGLFIIIPVFSPYLQNLSSATPLLIGMTMGVYGLTQAVFQIPFGILSDYIGRREVITLGLALFFIGSLVAGFGSNIWTVLCGRALQGAGAISGALMALLSDLTSEDSRTKAMAVVGMSIGAAFIMAFMLGPMLASVLSINNIFYLIAALVLPILYILWRVVPMSQLPAPDTFSGSIYSKGYQDSITKLHDPSVPNSTEPSLSYQSILEPSISDQPSLEHKNNKVSLNQLFSQLKLHCFGIFTLHGILMANFLAIPLFLKQMNLSSFDQGMIYVKVFLLAILFMLPMLYFSEKKQRQSTVLLIAIALLLLSEGIFWLFSGNFWGIMLGLVIFFTGFNILEASLPSIISKLAPKQSKGAALGIYSTAQFLGPMIGGVSAGVLFKFFSLSSIFFLGLVWAGIWLVLALYTLNFGIKNSKNIQS